MTIKDELWKHIGPTVEPLSSDSYIIKTDKSEKTWIFDVGSNSDAMETLSSHPSHKNVIISHFHDDHTYNLRRVKFDRVYVSAYSAKHIKECISDYSVVEDDIYIEDGDLKIHIFEIPSSHSKGCLGLEINEEYAFLGDAAYA